MRNAGWVAASASLVARDDIENAARAGYLDVLAGRGFCDAYETAERLWQRNYESGRLWGTGILKAGVTPPEWPAGVKYPAGMDAALRRVRDAIGPSRPEDVLGYTRPPPHIIIGAFA